MGICGLLPFVDGAAEQVHVTHLRGKRCAVDGYAWLHRGAKTCPLELARGMHTDKYVEYCVRLVKMLISNGIEPLMVFDGAPLPAKAATETERRLRRKKHLKEAELLLQNGERTRALEAYHKAVDITPEHAHALICALRRLNVRSIVAPYEADAQLAHLARNGHVDFVITEDSDLLAFGCPAVLYKMDASGNGKLIRRAALASVAAPHAAGRATPPLFSPWERWDSRLFLDLCILAGCDYLPSMPSFGLKSAHKMLKIHGSAELVVKVRSMEAREAPPGGFGEYARQLRIARETFLHQRVYDVATRRVVPLNAQPKSRREGGGANGGGGGSGGGCSGGGSNHFGGGGGGGGGDGIVVTGDMGCSDVASMGSVVGLGDEVVELGVGGAGCGDEDGDRLGTASHASPMAHCGEDLPAHLAVQICEACDLHPQTHLPLGQRHVSPKSVTQNASFTPSNGTPPSAVSRGAGGVAAPLPPRATALAHSHAAAQSASSSAVKPHNRHGSTAAAASTNATSATNATSSTAVSSTSSTATSANAVSSTSSTSSTSTLAAAPSKASASGLDTHARQAAPTASSNSASPNDEVGAAAFASRPAVCGLQAGQAPTVQASIRPFVFVSAAVRRAFKPPRRDATEPRVRQDAGVDMPAVANSKYFGSGAQQPAMGLRRSTHAAPLADIGNMCGARGLEKVASGEDGGADRRASSIGMQATADVQMNDAQTEGIAEFAYTPRGCKRGLSPSKARSRTRAHTPRSSAQRTTQTGLPQAEHRRPAGDSPSPVFDLANFAFR